MSMISYYEIFENVPQEIRSPLIKGIEQLRQEMLDTVRRSDFDELKKIVADLAISQKELAEAQKRTEQKVEELAEAQKETQREVTRLDRALNELAEAQKRTEQKVEELAEAQKETQREVTRLDRALNELAEAQKRTEQRLDSLTQKVEKLTEAVHDIDERLNKLTDQVRILSENLTVLTKSHINLKEMVGGLSHTVGYRLEDESYKALPGLLKERMSIEVIDRIKREYVEIAKDKYIEVNIIGRARDAKKEYVIVGEAKTQLKRKDIDDFIKKAEELKRFLRGEQLRILVTYQTSPQVQRYAKEKGVLIFFSYEF